jgi:hypothetical protein
LLIDIHWHCSKTSMSGLSSACLLWKFAYTKNDKRIIKMLINRMKLGFEVSKNTIYN